jgi:hypothetical protein
MNVRATKLLLQITTALLLSAAIASVVAGLILPVDLDQPSPSTIVPVTSGSHATRLPPVDSFSPLFSRSLQASTADAVAAVPAAADTAQAAVPVSQLELVGTIGNSVALIKGPDGTVAMVEVGDDVNGAPVLAIRPSQVDLRISGKTTTLQKSPPPDDATVIVGE